MTTDEPGRGSPVRLGLALALAPAGWTALLVLGWALWPVLCEHGATGAVHGIAAVGLALGLAGVALGARRWRARRDGPADSSFAPLLAVLLGSLFTLGIVLMWVLATTLARCP